MIFEIDALMRFGRLVIHEDFRNFTTLLKAHSKAKSDYWQNKLELFKECDFNTTCMAEKVSNLLVFSNYLVKNKVVV